MPYFIDLLVPLDTPAAENFLEVFPVRSPGRTAEAVRELIADKTICDVGCAKGDMVVAFGKYARRSFGINNYKPEIEVARGRGLEVVEADAIAVDPPAADFYFIYWSMVQGEPFIANMLSRHPGPFTILCSGYENTPWQRHYIERFGAKVVYTFPFTEETTHHPHLAPASGIWWLVSIEKPSGGA